MNIRLSDNQNERDRYQKDREGGRERGKAEWMNIKPAHEKLWIWQKANSLHLEICDICRTLPAHERFKLRPQIERSSKSVKDNIAEGNESYYYNDKMKGFFHGPQRGG